jgi:hypothetical protein
LDYEQLREGEYWYFRIARRTIDRDVWHDPRAWELLAGVDWNGQDLALLPKVAERIKRVRISAEGEREEIGPDVVLEEDEEEL